MQISEPPDQQQKTEQCNMDTIYQCLDTLYNLEILLITTEIAEPKIAATIWGTNIA